MMHTSKTLDITKVTGHRTEHLGIQKFNEAIGFRDEREKSFKSVLTTEEREKYLDSLKEELNARCKGLKHQIFEIGELLFVVKKILPHGEFKPWINDNFEFCYETAHNYMKVYIVCMGNPEIVEYFKPSSLYVISNPKFPEGLRKALFKGVKGPVDIKKKDLVQIALQIKKGELTITDKEVQDLLIRQRDISLWEEYKIELKAINQLISKRLERIVELSRIQTVNPLIKTDTDEEEQVRQQVQNKIIEKVEQCRDEIDTMLKELDEKCK